MDEPKVIKFDVYFPGDNSASETITITVESGDPGGDPGEFETFMCVVLSEWFDGAGVRQVK